MLSVPILIHMALFLPLLAMAGVILLHRHPNLREAFSLIAGVGLLGVVIVLYLRLQTGQSMEVSWLSLMPGLEVAFRIDTLGMLFALVAASLWPVTTLYAIGYMRGHGESHQTRFYSFFAISISAVMGIAFAANLFTLFIFYEVLTLCTYPLVTHGGDDKAKRGGRVYISILLSTSILFFLPAIIATHQLAGTLDFHPGGIFPPEVASTTLGLLLALFVFGIGKAAIMPLHRWLPAAMVAPTPVSALLHAVAVVKAGVFSILKVCLFIFGPETLSGLTASTVLAYLAGFSILAASLIAMRQDNLKARLAYSTISQLSYITLGALLVTNASITGSFMHIVTHAFAKITLFFCAGAILVASHKTRVSELNGLGRQMPITMVAFFLASLSIIGLPPGGGTWSKWYLLMGTLEADQWILMATLLVSSILNIFYLLPIPIRAFFAAPEVVSAPSEHKRITEAPLPSLIAIVVVASISVMLFFYPQFLAHMASALI
jgi:multicomponent Na+:H+ antiporter subunit D